MLSAAQILGGGGTRFAYTDQRTTHLRPAPFIRICFLEVLSPIAEAEVAHHQAADAAMYGPEPDWDEEEPEFPEDDGPVFVFGGRALVDASWAAEGEDPLVDVRGVLLPVLDDAVPGPDGQVTADALIGAFATEYRCEQPGDAEVLERLFLTGTAAAVSAQAATAAHPVTAASPVHFHPFTIISPNCREDTFLSVSAEFGGPRSADSGCSGHNLAPTLHWYNVSAGTKSFALTITDVDAPVADGFHHSIVTTSPSGRRPSGYDSNPFSQGTNNYGTAGTAVRARRRTARFITTSSPCTPCRSRT
jgi:phosphatidylethanolamine-binding protein (PEBP) family uncharacterized protein